MKKEWKFRRPLAWMLSAAMVITLMPGMAFAAEDSGTYKDGSYSAESTKGWGGKNSPVKVSVTIQDGRITALTSPEHAGESYWDVQNVDALLQRILDTENNIEAVQKGLNEEGGIDAATGATYSSTAVIDAVQKALAEARTEEPSDDPADVHYARVSLVDSSYVAYANNTVYDNSFVNPSVTYTIDNSGDYVFTLNIQPAEDVKVSKWDDRTVDFAGKDITGIDYSTPYSYQKKTMTVLKEDAEAGTKEFQFVIPGSEIQYLTQLAFQLTFEVSSEKQAELGSAWPLATYMSIDLTKDEPPAEDGIYVLMNIPYADFYKAELGETDAAVDAVTSSTLNKPRTGTLAGGSYHVDPAGSDISGVIYPVLVKDMEQLEGLTEVTDESSVTISVTNRGNTTETTYNGKDALFESADYSYYKLDEKPARYKTLTMEDGAKSFSAVSGRAAKVESASGAVNEAGHHADVEIKLADTAGIEQGQSVSGVVVTFDDGSKAGLRHVTEIWRATEIGGTAEQFAGKTITNVRYYTQDSVIDFPMTIGIKKKAADATAEFTDASTIQITGLPEDIENPLATVQTQVGRGETPTVIAETVEVKDGVIAAAEAAENGKTYSITISSDNYLPVKATADYNEAFDPNHENCPSAKFKDVGKDKWYHEGIDYAVEKGMMNGVAEDAFNPEGTTTRAMIVTILYRLEGEPAADASTFTDLKEGSWYEGAVNWAAANGIVNGYDEKTFGPDDAITREQMARILYKYAELKGKDLSASADLGSFTDNGSVSGYAKDAMAWAVGVELINGVTETTLEPQGSATRAQVATLMMRLCENVLK